MIHPTLFTILLTIAALGAPIAYTARTLALPCTEAIVEDRRTLGEESLLRKCPHLGTRCATALAVEALDDRAPLIPSRFSRVAVAACMAPAPPPMQSL